MRETNMVVREQIEKYRLRYFEVAKKIGITDSTFSRWLRYPLQGDRKQRVNKAIEELKKEVG